VGYPEEDLRSLLPAVMPMVKEGGSGEFICNVQVSVAADGILLVEDYDEASSSPVESGFLLFASLEPGLERGIETTTELVKVGAPLEWKAA
jgi:hypothetical protein